MEGVNAELEREFEKKYDEAIKRMDDPADREEAEECRSFARKAWTRMQRLGLKNTHVAERMGTRSHAQIESWIFGEAKRKEGKYEDVPAAKRPLKVTPIRLSQLRKLARALGCTPAYLADDSVTEPQGRPSLDPDRERVLALAETIGLEDATAILTIVRKMGGGPAFAKLISEDAGRLG